MPRTLRNHAVVRSDHSVIVRAPELAPGATVEVIVVMDSVEEREMPPGASFIDAVAGVTIDAPEDFGTHAEYDSVDARTVDHTGVQHGKARR